MFDNTKERRYPINKEFYYDLYFAAEGKASSVLNSIPEQVLLEQLRSSLDLAEKRKKAYASDLDENEYDVKLYRKQLLRKGDPKANIETDKQREDRLKIEAKVDITNLEINILESAIQDKEFEAREQPRAIMPRGPIGHRSISGITGCGYTDGQTVTLINDQPVIDDARSPYDGLSVIDYMEHIVAVWKSDRDKALAKLQEDYKAKGIKPEDQVRRVKVRYPDFPKDCMNHKAEVEATETEK